MNKLEPVRISKRGFFARSWWFIAILFVIISAFARADSKKKDQIADIQHRIELFRSEKKMALSEREELLSRLNSQSDPAWVELVLMKEIGVVPEGKLKVHFTTD